MKQIINIVQPWDMMNFEKKLDNLLKLNQCKKDYLDFYNK